MWPLDPHHIETRCNQRDLWLPNSDSKNEKKSTSNFYWEHDVALIDSRSDRICVLMGVLSFLNGRWELRDRSGSVECVAVDRDCQQFRDRCVFASKFAVHRESFTIVGDSTEQHQRVYVSIDEFHAASLPLAKPDVNIDQTSSVDGVRFLALNKSMPQLVFCSTVSVRHVFGYLVVASLHGQWIDGDLPPNKRPRKDGLGYTQSDDEGPAKCILFFHHDHPTMSYPALVEGRVYEIRLAKRELLASP